MQNARPSALCLEVRTALSRRISAPAATPYLSGADTPGPCSRRFSRRFTAAAALCCELNRRYSSVHCVRVYYTGFHADVNVRVLCFGRKRRTANVCLTEHFLLTRTFVFYEIFSETYTIRSNICPSFTIATAFPFIMYYCKKRNQYRFRPLVTLT